LLYSPVDHRDLHSFPTRRSSDLCTAASPKRNFVPRWRGKMPEGQMGAKLAEVSHRNSPARSPRSPAARVLPPQGGGRGFGGEGGWACDNAHGGVGQTVASSETMPRKVRAPQGTVPGNAW